MIGGLTLEDTLTSRDNINSQLRAVLDEATGSGAAQVGRQRLGEPDEPDLPLLDQLRERADGLLDRRRGVDAVLLVEVDGLDAEAAQARLTRLRARTRGGR